MSNRAWTNAGSTDGGLGVNHLVSVVCLLAKLVQVGSSWPRRAKRPDLWLRIGWRGTGSASRLRSRDAACRRGGNVDAEETGDARLTRERRTRRRRRAWPGAGRVCEPVPVPASTHTGTRWPWPHVRPVRAGSRTPPRLRPACRVVRGRPARRRGRRRPPVRLWPRRSGRNDVQDSCPVSGSWRLGAVEGVVIQQVEVLPEELTVHLGSYGAGAAGNRRV